VPPINDIGFIRPIGTTDAPHRRFGFTTIPVTDESIEGARDIAHRTHILEVTISDFESFIGRQVHDG
jgi:hypothetical protein